MTEEDLLKLEQAVGPRTMSLGVASLVAGAVAEVRYCRDLLRAKNASLDAANAELRLAQTLVRHLRDFVERHAFDAYGDGWPECLDCGKGKDSGSHSPNCELVALLGREPATKS